MEMNNAEIAQKLAVVLSDVVKAKFILHGYHWNVIGPDFTEYHSFFAGIYEDIDGSIDPLAENILKVGFPAPYLLADFIEMSCIDEERLDGSSPQFLLQSALRVVEHLGACHQEAFHVAEQSDLQGLMNFLAERIDAYAKWSWQIKAHLGVR